MQSESRTVYSPVSGLGNTSGYCCASSTTLLARARSEHMQTGCQPKTRAG